MEEQPMIVGSRIETHTHIACSCLKAARLEYRTESECFSLSPTGCVIKLYQCESS